MKPISTQSFKSSPHIAFFLLLFLSIFPFQPKHPIFSKTLTKFLFPSHFSFPVAFSKQLGFDLSDLIIMTLCALLIFRFRVTVRELFWEGTSKALTLFLSISYLSIIFSDTASYLFPYLFLFKFSLAYLLFHILRVVCKTSFSYWYLLVARVIVMTATGASVIGITQYFWQAPIGLSWIGETSLHFLSFFNPTQQRWVLDALLSITTSSEVLFRSSAVFYHANPFGGFLFCSLLCTDFLYLKKRGHPILLGFLIFLQTFALFTTFSRSAMLAVFLSTSLLLFFQCKNPLIRQRLKQLGAIFFSSVIFCFSMFYPQLLVRGGVVNYPPLTQHADQERMTYQRVALQMAKEHPLLGVGFNHFQFSLPSYLPQGQEHSLLYKVHNIFLLVLAETGGLGLLAFVFFLFSVVKRGISARSTLESQVLLCIFIGFTLIGGCDMYLLENQKLRYLLFIILGLLTACQKPSIELEEG